MQLRKTNKPHLTLLALLLVLGGCTKINESHEDCHCSAEAHSEAPIPTIFIDVDPEEYQDMWNNYEDEIEIESYVTIKRDGEIILDEVEAEFEIRGSRSATFDIKSFGLKFEDTQSNEDRKIINPPNVLPFHSIDNIKSLRLRNSGNDYEYTYIKDASFTHLAIGMGLDIDLMYYEPAQIYINGTYYGLLNMRTESNSHGVSRLYDAKKKDVTMFKINTPGKLVIKDGDADRINELVTQTEQGNIEHLYEEVDLDNFIDYVIFQTLLANGDWPQNNIRMYAIKEGSFRCVLYDLDYACSFFLDKEPLYYVRDGNDSAFEQMFEVFYNDDGFKKRFNERFIEVLKMPQSHPEAFNQIVNEITYNVEESMECHILKRKEPDSMLEWYRNIEEFKGFYKRRYDYVKKLYGL